MSERHVAEVLREVFRRGGMLRGMQRAEAVRLWPEVVGPEVARFSTAVAVQGGVLVVDVPDPETALHLGMQRHHVLAAYRDRLGHGGVKELRFRVGRRDGGEPAIEAPAAAPAPDPEAVAAMARAMTGLQEPLAGPALQAGKALLALRAQRAALGWRPCPVCGVVAEPPAAPARDDDPHAWCPTCRRHAGSPRVVRAAERFAVQPFDRCPELTADERAVARRLALRQLRSVALELLPRSLGDPALRGPLERAVACAAALHHDLPEGATVRDEHYRGAVDDKVLRALGVWGRGP